MIPAVDCRVCSLSSVVGPIAHLLSRGIIHYQLLESTFMIGTRINIITKRIFCDLSTRAIMQSKATIPQELYGRVNCLKALNTGRRLIRGIPF